jgi:NAD(P)H-flavin reductase/ferredoxin
MMRRICKVRANGEEFSANCGDLLLDAALLNGVDIPHDCRSGVCGACQVNLLSGRVLGGMQDGNPGVVRACQCRVLTDVAIEIEDVPESVTAHGRVKALVPLAPDVMEVSIAMPQRAEYLAGQHYKVQFRGFPARYYSPTFPLDTPHNPAVLRFHIRLVPNGRVSPELGGRIRVGHPVKLTGPLGTAYFRGGHPGRLVIVAGGTGFAPMWSIVNAALAERRDRTVVFVAGARTLRSFYMVRALCRLAHFAGVTIIPVVAEPQTISNAVRIGRPTDVLPRLKGSDVVYTAGAPAMVEAVAHTARAAGARCYADPFAPQHNGPAPRSLLARATQWLGSNAPPLVPDMPAAIQEVHDR